MRILLIEDEADIRSLVELHLKRLNHSVDQCDGHESMTELIEKASQSDLLILDWMLPKHSGPEILKSLRLAPRGGSVPVLMLTARASNEDVVTGLDAGADDYLTKPFSISVLLARVTALLRRRPEGKTSELVCYRGVTLDPNFADALVNDQRAGLTLSEFKTLRLLIAESGRVLTRSRLIDEVKGQGVTVVERTIDNHILGIRKKLPVLGDFVESIRGVGYRVLAE